MDGTVHVPALRPIEPIATALPASTPARPLSRASLPEGSRISRPRALSRVSSSHHESASRSQLGSVKSSFQEENIDRNHHDVPTFFQDFGTELAMICIFLLLLMLFYSMFWETRTASIAVERRRTRIAKTFLQKSETDARQAEQLNQEEQHDQEQWGGVAQFHPTLDNRWAQVEQDSEQPRVIRRQV